MHDAAFVRGVERVGNLPRDGARVLERKGAVDQAIGERRPLDELEHQGARVPADVGRAVVNAVDRADVLVIQRGEQLGLTLEAGEAIGVGARTPRAAP